MSTPRNRTNYVGREDEDVTNVIFRVRMREGKTTPLTPQQIKPGWVKQVKAAPKRVREPKPIPADQRDKIHPILRERLQARPLDERHEVMIVFRENLAIPRFPEPQDRQSRDSATNKRLLSRADELVKEITAKREEGYRVLTESMKEFDGRVLETFWLINAVLVEMPLNAVARLADREDIVSIEPRDTGEKPPQSDVDDARGLLVSDPYFNLGQTAGFIGLLDTGLRFSHTLFNNPSHISLRVDSTNTGAGADPADDCWNHGTSTGAIITGNNNLTNDHRGVTAITLDSFKVYPSGCGTLDSTAVVRAFQDAVKWLDRVIVAEMQSGSDDLGSISQAADAAFDAGAVVIAANGNNGPNPRTVNAPANAHRAIGVGAFDVVSGNLESYQSRGPTRDSRYKPDIQAPTNTVTASNASDTATHSFGGTSGATPYGAGVAALLRNWLRGNSGSIDPGQVYAQMILSGQQPYPFNNDNGAGHLKMPVNGWAWWGKLNVGNGDQIDIPISVGSKITKLDAALWWPEFVFNLPFMLLDPHNDIDLYWINPAGVQCAASISTNSVFERVRVTSPIAQGTWKLRIRGFNVVTGPQVVYWTAAAMF